MAATKRGRPPAAVVLSEESRAELERRVRAGTTAQRDVVRAQIVLAAAEGLGSCEVAERLGVSVDMVSTWRGRFQVETHSPDEPPEAIARATPLGGGAFGLSFRTHTGRWEPMPVGGTMENIAEAVTDLLGPYIDPQNLR